MPFMKRKKELVDQVERPRHGVFMIPAANLHAEPEVALADSAGDPRPAGIQPFMFGLMACAS